jgi:hypothetical protein
LLQVVVAVAVALLRGVVVLVAIGHQLLVKIQEAEQAQKALKLLLLLRLTQLLLVQVAQVQQVVHLLVA